MPFLRDGIDGLRATVLPDTVAAGGHSAAFSRTALVTWKSCIESVLYQVYVNGQLAGATVDPHQRRLVVQIPSAFEAAVHLEVVAVERTDAHRDLSSEIGYTPVNSGRARLTLLRSQSLPAAAQANICFDNGTGSIDYDTPLNEAPIPIWPCWQDKAGFGAAQFGSSDFGYEATAAVGFGKGIFGQGQFGLDADTVTWISPALPLGAYRFGVKIVDSLGNESLACETEPITVVPTARPASALKVVTLDEQTNQLTLSIRD
jgi:hypothetical protein